MALIERKKLAIFDPDTNLFVAKGWGPGWVIAWTDKLDQVQTYVDVDSALRLIKLVTSGSRDFKGKPDAQLVEVTVSMTWEPASFLILQETERFKKYKATYEQFLPAYQNDPDRINRKDWEKFKTARHFLQEHGYEVEK